MRFEVDFPHEALDTAMDVLAGHLADEEIAKVLKTALTVIQTHLVRETMARLAKDPTGALARSWTVRLEAKGAGQWLGIVGSHLPYAEIHNKGGTITPKAGKYLAIPIRPLVPRGMSPRDDPTPMKLIRSKGGNPLLAEVGKGGRDAVRYVLRRSVDIPATFYVDAAIRSSHPDVDAAILAAVEDALIAASGSPA